MPCVCQSAAPHPPVAYDTLGTATNISGGSSGSWTHVLASGANCIVVACNHAETSSSATVTIKIGTTVVPSLGNYQYTNNSGYYWNVQLYGLLNPPTGSQTLTLSDTSGGYTAANSFSYFNAVQFGSTQTSTGSGTAASQTSSGASGSRIIQIFAGANASPGSISWSGYKVNGIAATALWNLSSSTAASQTIVGDATGGASVVISATDGQSTTWGGISVPILS